jgi:hypothetical protein
MTERDLSMDVEEYVQGRGVVYKRDLFRRFQHQLGDVDALDQLIEESPVLSVGSIQRKTAGRPAEIVISLSYLLSLFPSFAPPKPPLNSVTTTVTTMTQLEEGRDQKHEEILEAVMPNTAAATKPGTTWRKREHLAVVK